MSLNDFILTVLASASVSAGLTAALVWLTKSWIGERIKGAIQHEYAQKLETHKTQLQVQHDRDLERLKSELGDIASERNARRDYEYEARKKLYAQYEPLLFQLIENAENGYYRVLSLARTVREGNLTAEGGWLEHPDYYMSSTIYKLLAPMALFKVIQRSLTFVDLSVDPGIAATYTLAKILYLTFTCDFELAAAHPPIKYDPLAADADNRRTQEPQQFWRQGVPQGILDNVLDDCLLSVEKPVHLRTFGEFERAVEEREKDHEWHGVDLFVEIFHNFHPATRPVLWRVLVAQAHIHRLLIARVGSRSDSPQEEILSKLALAPRERERFDFGHTASSHAFPAAEKFVTDYFREFRLGA